MRRKLFTGKWMKESEGRVLLPSSESPVVVRLRRNGTWSKQHMLVPKDASGFE